MDNIIQALTANSGLQTLDLNKGNAEAEELMIDIQPFSGIMAQITDSINLPLEMSENANEQNFLNENEIKIETINADDTIVEAVNAFAENKQTVDNEDDTDSPIEADMVIQLPVIPLAPIVQAVQTPQLNTVNDSAMLVQVPFSENHIKTGLSNLINQPLKNKQLINSENSTANTVEEALSSSVPTLETSLNFTAANQQNTAFNNAVTEHTDFNVNLSAENDKDEAALQILDNEDRGGNIAPSFISNERTSVPTPAYQKLELNTHTADPEWGNKLNEQVVWLVQHKINSASIKLNPQELGPIEVKIHMTNDNAAVNITTHTHQVRDLIEQALPLLKEMMVDQGISLTEVNIQSNANQRETAEQQNQNNNYYQTQASELEEEQTVITTTELKRTQGIIDYFA